MWVTQEAGGRRQEADGRRQTAEGRRHEVEGRRQNEVFSSKNPVYEVGWVSPADIYACHGEVSKVQLRGASKDMMAFVYVPLLIILLTI
ncbi:hypothetical protein [Phormidium nigroviride]